MENYDEFSRHGQWSDYFFFKEVNK